MNSLKSRFIALSSSLGALLTGCFGGACGAVCLAGGCCGGPALFGLIGLSGSTLAWFDKFTPLFLILTILSLSYAFYKAYQPKPAACCDPADANTGESCCPPNKKTTFLQSKSFLWATTIMVVIMWTYPIINQAINPTPACLSAEEACCSGDEEACCTPMDESQETEEGDMME